MYHKPLKQTKKRERERERREIENIHWYSIQGIAARRAKKYNTEISQRGGVSKPAVSAV